MLKSNHLVYIMLMILSGTFLVVALSDATKNSSNVPFWTGHPDAAAFEKKQDDRIRESNQALSRMLSAKGSRTIQNTLEPYDEAWIYLDEASSQSLLIENVHPDAALREAAEKARQRVEKFKTDLSLNRLIYEALAAIDLREADLETRNYVERTLRDYRLAGVEKDKEIQTKIKLLREDLIKVGQDFARNINEDKRTVIINNLAELEGLPRDFIERHKPEPNGKIVLTLHWHEVSPVLTYAKSDDLRRRVYTEFWNRAHPQNVSVLNQMISKRYEIARFLGFSSWADYITADKMVENAKNASAFLNQVDQASRPIAQREYQELLKCKQRQLPDATGINAWERDYWAEMVRKSRYDFDSQQVRAYFPYTKVKEGVLAVMAKLFGITFREVKNAPVWHPSVECWEMLSEKELVGRFYLDMHPRPNKYKGGAYFNIRTGVAGRQIPEAALVCNFAGAGRDGNPGLMEHNDVRTFFHEFGHLLHSLLAGNRQWVGTGGIMSLEQDFQEVPSQVLEEWIWDADTLAIFAKHYQSGEPIPANLVKQMRRANEFGKALITRRQMIYAKLALALYDRAQSEVNPDLLAQEIINQYDSFPYVEGTHLQCSLAHLYHHSAALYTYLWSQVIAKDLFSQFDKSNLFNTEITKNYRDSILAPGASARAEQLIENFLGRPFNFKAWQAWLNN